MSESSTIYVGLDQHTESITVSYVGADRSLEPICLGPIGPRTSDVDAMVRKLQSKAIELPRFPALHPLKIRLCFGERYGNEEGENEWKNKG